MQPMTIVDLPSINAIKLKDRRPPSRQVKKKQKSTSYTVNKTSSDAQDTIFGKFFDKNGEK